MSKDYRFLGKATPRKDALEIVTGKAKYIDDIRPAAMLHGEVLRSPYPHAEIRHIDTTRAEAVAGVKAVLTYKNVPPWRTGMPKHMPVLDHKVRFVGDAVALVAAETHEAAAAALDLIEVEYEKIPAVYDMEAALEPGAPLLHEAFPNNLVSKFPAFGPKTLTKVVRGDVEKGFEEADFISEGSFGYENVANPLPIEPPGVIAQWEGDLRLTVWSGTQSASWHRWVMQSKMGFPDIRAITTQCGGSFGSKNYAPQCLFYAAALAQVTDRAVKVYYTKDEHFGAFVLRLGSRFRGRIGIKKDGTVTAVAGDWMVDTGAYSDMTQAQIAVGCGEAQLMLKCENWDLSTRLICTNRCASGVIRGFGGQELESALAPILADVMSRADLDPVQFFKKNYVKPGDGYVWREGNHWTCRGKDYSDTMVNPFDFGLVGSRGTYAVGSAIIGAAEDAVQKLYELAAPKLGAAPEELETVDGRVFVRDNPEQVIGWSKAIGIMHTVTGFGTYRADYSVPNFLILFVEVEVDTGTGAVKVRKVLTATDVGQIIDPPSLHGQLYGALGSAGLDTAVFEETVIDTNSGHMLNMNMTDYKWRTFDDLPEFENVILETPFPTHRFKAIGVGEVATSPGPGAVLMAVSNAVGKHLHHYPLTPDRILEALGRLYRVGANETV